MCRSVNRFVGVSVCAFGGGIMLGVFLPASVLVVLEGAVILTVGVLCWC